MEFYPCDATVPETAHTPRLLLRPLREVDAALDYDAVMASAEQLRAWSQSPWPAADFTLEQNREDLRRHEREHREREAFTYTVLDPAGTRCLGCVYLQPVRAEAAAVSAGAATVATVAFWVRTEEIANDLDRHLFGTLLEWLRAEWRFDRVVFTIAESNQRQAALLAEAGLEARLHVTLKDGRRCRIFGA